MDAAARDRALEALEIAKTYIGKARLEVDAEALDIVKAAGDRIQRANSAFVLSILRDEWCPAKLFHPWASVRRIQDWGVAKKVAVEVKHGRSCVKPSDFFRHFATLRE